MDTDLFVLSMDTNIINKYLKNFEDIFDFSILNKDHDLFSNRNRKVMDKIKI